MIDIVTAGVCSGMYFTTQVGRSSVNGAVDHADELVVHRDRRPGVAGLPAHLVDDGAGLVARPPRDAAGVAGGAAQLARHLAERRVGADAVDPEAVDAGDRPHQGRVELDDRVVEAFVARHHGAKHAVVLGALGGHLWRPARRSART